MWSTASTALATVPSVLLHGTAPFESVDALARYLGLGIAFGWIYVATGSLWAAVVAHAGWNLAVTIRHTPGYLAGGDSVRPVAS